MFKLSVAGTYSWPVNFHTPVDGGKQEKQSFDVVFKRVPQSKIKDILNKSESGEMTVEQFCEEVVAGFNGVKDEGGEDVPFSHDALSKLMDVPGVTKAIFNSFVDSLSGQKIKN